MPSKRGDWYHIRRTIQPFGEVQKTLNTRSKRVAERRERMLLDFAKEGRWVLLRAFIEGDVRIEELEEAKQKRELHELKERLEAPNVSFEAALEEAETMKKADDNISDRTWDGYESRLRAFRKFAIERPDLEEEDKENAVEQGTGSSYTGSHDADNPYAEDGERGGAVPLRELLSDDLVRAYKTYRKESQGRSNQTVNNDMSAIAALAECALENDWIDEKPTLKRYSPPKRTRHLGPDEIRRYLKAVRPRFRTFMRLLLTTGMRLGEGMSLRVYHFDPDGPELTVETSKTDAGSRRVPLTEEMGARLPKHIDEHSLEPGDPLFSFGRRTVQKEHNRACRDAEIPDYTLHDHRHTAAVHLAKSGTPMHLIRDILGHKHLKSTERYARYRPGPGELRPYVDELGERLGFEGADEREEG